MNKIVVDTNVILKWVSSDGEDGVSNALKIYEQLKAGKLEVHAPIFLQTELLNILFWKKKCDPEIIRAIFSKLAASGIVFHSDAALESTSDLMDLVFKYKLTSYDAQFLFLAKELSCQLISCDEGLLDVKEHVVDLKDLFKTDHL